MDHIRKQSKTARRRLTVERFLRFLPWTMGVAALVAVVGLVMPKIVALQVDNTVWFASWLGGGAALGLLVNFWMTFVGRPTLPDAAVEIDRRFALRERLSSALVLTPEDRETELGKALADDANRRAEGLDVRDQFSFGFNRRLLLPILPAMLAAALWYVPNREPDEILAKKDDAATVKKVKNSTNPLMEQIKKKRKQAEKEGLNEAADLFKQLEGELAKLQKDAKLDTKQTLAKLNDIKEQIAERRKELGSADALRKNLKNMQKFESGPAEKLLEAMKKGDFNKAEEALEELLNKMENGQMDAAAMQKMQKQMEQMQKAISEAAQDREQAKEAIKEQMEQAEASGDMQKAAQLQRKLEQMAGADANMAQLQEMADKLAQASESMKQGDMQSASEAMQDMMSQLQQMNQSDSELQDLDELMDSLSQSKSQMTCKQCNGMGCASCMGSSMMQGQIPGQGMGQGAGQGERPEEEDEVDFFDSQVRDQMKLGETVYGGQVGGANRKGSTQFEVQESILASMSEEPEPLDETPLPKLQREHTRSYFNAVREGKN